MNGLAKETRPADEDMLRSLGFAGKHSELLDLFVF
jgi:hypothetical protein